MGNATGSEFEREFCKGFSKWLDRDSDNPRDDLVWRSAGSGASAKMRMKSGKESRYPGDIEPRDPMAVPFLNLFSIELKYGYGSWDILDVMDSMRRKNPSLFEQFWAQATEDAAQATPEKTPLLVTKRKARKAMVFMPRFLFSQLQQFIGRFSYTTIQFSLTDGDYEDRMRLVVGMKLEDFYSWVDPKIFESMTVFGGHNVDNNG